MSLIRVKEVYIERSQKTGLVVNHFGRKGILTTIFTDLLKTHVNLTVRNSYLHHKLQGGDCWVEEWQRSTKLPNLKKLCAACIV